MKKSIIVTLTICIAFFNSDALKAQDIIHRKNGKTIEAKVLEITADDVKYKMFTQPNGVTITIDVALVKKIVFENGMVQKFDEGSSYDN